VSTEDDVIRASEIGQYAYCARAWWLARVLGYRPANVAELQAGQAWHQAHGRSVDRSLLLQRLAVGLFLLAGLLLAAWLLLALVP
jgi:hypothetical protein